jgi:hypothetical protein
MTEKRFENRLNKDTIKFNTLNPIWDNLKEDALNVFEMIDLLNELHKENKELKNKLHFVMKRLNEKDRLLARVLAVNKNLEKK